MNKDLLDLNKIGKRIIWCREKLGMTVTEARLECGMPKSTYTDRESGARSRYIEDYLVIARFFNSKWKERLGQAFPMYDGIVITEIKVAWLMFGVTEE